MWVSVWAGPQLPVLLDLETSVIKMVITFQCPDIYTDLGGVGQCLHFKTERTCMLVWPVCEADTGGSSCWSQAAWLVEPAGAGFRWCPSL